MNRVSAFFKNNGGVIALCVAIMCVTALTEYMMGRLPLGPDGKFGWWDGDLRGHETSQRFADFYSFTHIVHGILWYGLFWLVARKKPVRYRFLGAVLIEASWEILENSSYIISNYRQSAIAHAYFGDSILNSMSDILMMMCGFLLASKLKTPLTIGLVIALELLCLYSIRDNLTLNLLHFIYPIKAIDLWQAAGR